MNKTFHYYLVANTGASTQFDVVERSESIANVEAKITAERWLDRLSLTPADLSRFDLAHVSPA
jgi:hypothetical protein